LTPQDAESAALTWASSQKPVAGLAALRSVLFVFREGLMRGVPGDSHLAYEVEVGDGARVRELVYVDAHMGRVLERMPGTHDAMYREVRGSFPYVEWIEGDPFPTADPDINNTITFTGDTYNFFWNAFGRDSYDGEAGALYPEVSYDRCGEAFATFVAPKFCRGSSVAG
jgi:hypothetical protein